MSNSIAQQRITPGSLKIKDWPVRSSIILTLTAGVSGIVLVLAATKTGIAAEVTAPLLMMIGTVVIVLAWRKWETGVQGLLVVLIIEGAVRKWFLPSASELVYFYKDVLMIVIVLGYFRRGRKSSLLVKRELKLFSVTIGAFALYAMASISNPALPHPLVGVLGMKAYLLYIPLVYLVPRMFTSRQKLVAFLKWYLIIALFVGMLSAMQFLNSDDQSALNRYAWDDKTTEATGMDIPVAHFQDSVGTSYGKGSPVPFHISPVWLSIYRQYLLCC